MVRGIISKKEYSEKDIFDPHLYPRMKEEPLLDEDDCLVVPVRNRNAPHFRRIGLPSFGTRLGRNENNPTHDDCIKAIFKNLSNHATNIIKFSTYVFDNKHQYDNKRQYDEQVIFNPPIEEVEKERKYQWFMENDCRIAFSDGTYIKPDIAGRYSSKFFPSATYPNVILEVVRTHIPDLPTFIKLFELSKCNYHIYFYFITEGNKTSKINHFKTENNQLKIRVSHYLIGGKLFRNGKEFPSQRNNESFEDWYRFLENNYFLKAKENA